MTISAATVEEIFRDLGLFVRLGSIFEHQVPDMLGSEMAKERTRLDSGATRLEMLGRSLAQENQNVQQIESLVNGEVQLAEQYLTDYVKPTIEALGTSAADILADLAEQMIENCTPAQAVLRNEVALDGSVVADSDNEGDGTLGSVVLSQYIPAQRFTVECTDATTEGSEQWSVTGSVSGQLDSATTGEAYADTNVYLEFAITAGAAAFAVGDKFYFYVSCTEARYQTFFRDHFGVVMPSVATGSETIDEAWSE